MGGGDAHPFGSVTQQLHENNINKQPAPDSSGSPSSTPFGGKAGVEASMNGLPEFPFEGREVTAKKTSWKHYLGRYYHTTQKKQKRRAQTFSALDWVCFFLPLAGVLRKYNKSFLIPDLVAGLCIAFSTPRGMAYAISAGLPTVYGLYGAFSPVLAYGAFASSPHLSVGPVVVTSQLLRTYLVDIYPAAGAIADPSNPQGAEQIVLQDEYNRAAIQVGFLVAILYTAIGVFRLGFVIQFLSHSIIGGFVSGYAIIIGLGQLKSIVGIPTPNPAPVTLHELLDVYISGAHDLIWQTTLFGGMLVILLLTMKWIGGMRPHLIYVAVVAPLAACAVGLAAQYIGNVKNKGVPLIGTIPPGMPPVTISWWLPINNVGKLFPVAIVIMFVDMLESQSIAMALARKCGYHLAANQEIVALGIGNFVGVAFCSYTTTGSFGRSALLEACGARTPFAGFMSAVFVAGVMLWLTPVLENLPSCVMGAIVVSVMPSLFEYQQLIYLWKVNKIDAACWIICFCGVMFISVEIGLAIAIGLAVVIVILHSTFPHVVLLGRVPGASYFRSIQQYAEARMTPGIMAFRIESSVYFVNQLYIKSKVEHAREKYALWSTETGGVHLLYAIIDMSMVLHVDSAGCHALEDIISDFRKHNCQVLLANPTTKCIRSLEDAGVPDHLGREWIFADVSDAHVFCQAQLQEQGITAPACWSPLSHRQG